METSKLVRTKACRALTPQPEPMTHNAALLHSSYFLGERYYFITLFEQIVEHGNDKRVNFVLTELTKKIIDELGVCRLSKSHNRTAMKGTKIIRDKTNFTSKWLTSSLFDL